jgi:GTPase SAR1 family protein
VNKAVIENFPLLRLKKGTMARWDSLTLFSSFLVGKTSLITRFMYDTFDNAYQVRTWQKGVRMLFNIVIGELLGNHRHRLFIKDNVSKLFAHPSYFHFCF